MRQKILIGEDAQRKLGNSTAVVVGLGGTGGIAAQLLARAGVNLVLIDYDIVGLENLHRQVLYNEGDAGKSKAEVAETVLKAANPRVSIKAIDEDLNDGNADELVSGDIVLDCTDNMKTRYVLNRVCLKKKTPWVYSGALRWEGMVMPISKMGRPCLSCVFPRADKASFQNCAGVGVLGSVPNVIGSLAATEVLKILIGKAEYGKLYRYDAMKEGLEGLVVNAREDCEVCGRTRTGPLLH